MNLRYGLILFWTGCWLHVAQAESIDQSTTGWCSPAVHDTQGNVTVNCEGVDPKIVERLNELLDLKDIKLDEANQVAAHWLKKYNELTAQLAQRPASDTLAVEAREMLEKGQLEAAEALLQKSLSQNLARRAQLAQEKAALDKAAASDAYDLGSIKELQLAYREARTYYEQAASLAPDNTTYLYSAGFINGTLADYQKAIKYYEQALTSDLETFDEDHPNVAVFHNDLGEAWRELGQYHKAIKYYKQALASDLKSFGEDHPRVAIRRNNMGLAWKALGQYHKAIKYYEQALASNLKSFGENHPYVAGIRNNLGDTWVILGQHHSHRVFQAGLGQRSQNLWGRPSECGASSQ